MYPSEVAAASLDVSVVLPCYNERDHVELEIKRTCCPATRGAGTARRIGTQQATGRVVVWTDADMIYPNDRIPEFVSQSPSQGRDQPVPVDHHLGHPPAALTAAVASMANVVGLV
jgi:glycosyltransferase involved in cell wall biosynthesis